MKSVEEITQRIADIHQGYMAKNNEYMMVQQVIHAPTYITMMDTLMQIKDWMSRCKKQSPDSNTIGIECALRWVLE